MYKVNELTKICEDFAVKKCKCAGKMMKKTNVKKMSIKNCEKLCKKIRKLIIKTTSKNGGHLASNLGTVELTVAIHRNFDCPRDKIIFDVGHQSYTHKILTGRHRKFSTLRTENGISGFTKPCESECDFSISGHSGVALSTALGASEAMALDKNKTNYAVAVVGDGSMTNGQFYEALNNGGICQNRNLIVILNDNEMSISKNVGSLVLYLAKIRGNKVYVYVKKWFEMLLHNTPYVGEFTLKNLKYIKSVIKDAFYHITLFEDLGFVYLGPVDGHDIRALDKVLRAAKAYKSPVIIHAITTKGKGYAPSENNPSEYHGISPFNPYTGGKLKECGTTFSSVFGSELSKIAKKDTRICAITAAMRCGVCLDEFACRFPSRFFDVGIAEGHAVTFAAGLAKMGKIPVFAVYSSFLQRCYDQLMHDCAIENLHIVVAVDRAGIVGEDGETHQGVFDISMLTAVPNITILSPSNYTELGKCLHDAMYKYGGVVCVRYPRGSEVLPKKTAVEADKMSSETATEAEKNENNTLLISYGRLANNVNSAAEKLGVKCINMVRIFPIKRKYIEYAMKFDNVFFIEESYKFGSISEHFGRELTENGYKGNFYIKSIPNFVSAASVNRSIEKLGLDENGILKFVREYT
jgi:1-deoxy-D-xylulose-5-phosphate synthase